MSRPNSNKEERTLSELLQNRVYFIRGKKVMLSTHLAELYGTTPRVLVQAFKRNRVCFPGESWAFRLSADEFNALKSQFVISEYSHIRRMLPYVFTEQGMVVLSGLLRSDRAIAMNIAVIKFFVRKFRPYLKARGIGSDLW